MAERGQLVIHASRSERDASTRRQGPVTGLLKHVSRVDVLVPRGVDEIGFGAFRIP